MCFAGCTHWTPDCYYGNKLTWHSECAKICCIITFMCILKLANKDIYIYIYIKGMKTGQDCLYLNMGRPTILRLRCIVPLVYCPLCRKGGKIWLPRLSRMKHSRMYPTSITICLQTRQVHRNCNAQCDYRYTVDNRKLAVLLGCRWYQRGTLKWLLYTVVCTILITATFPNSLTVFWGYKTCMVCCCARSGILFYANLLCSILCVY
jgi:hypothetical protein